MKVQVGDKNIILSGKDFHDRKLIEEIGLHGLKVSSKSFEGDEILLTINNRRNLCKLHLCCADYYDLVRVTAEEKDCDVCKVLKDLAELTLRSSIVKELEKLVQDLSTEA